MQITLARQLGLVMHLARGRRHFLSRHRPMALPSEACAGSTVWIKPPIFSELKEIVKATTAAVTPFPTCDITLLRLLPCSLFGKAERGLVLGTVNVGLLALKGDRGEFADLGLLGVEKASVKKTQDDKKTTLENFIAVLEEQSIKR